MTKAQREMKARGVAIALGKLKGKQSIDSICEYLEGLGFIELPDDALRMLKHDIARKHIHNSKKYRNEDDTGPTEFLNLVEVLPDGSKEQYYKKISECNEWEAAQHMSKVYKNCKYWKKELFRLDDIFTATLGRDYQNRFDFEMPKRKPAMAE